MPSRPGSTDLVASPAAFGEPPPLVAAAPSSSPSPLSSSGGGPQGGALLFDRIFSCECLEHSKDYGKAFRAMSEVLKADGKVFVQILCHREYTYFMNNDDWMGRNFFTGGTIPSTKLFMFFTEHLVVDESWYIRGTEYSRTLDAWLANLHSNRRALMHVFQKNGYVSPAREIQKWRMFYIMSSVSFGFNKGKEWMVAYYTFSKR
jgi:cyclopropane-fatty-acyl-phospholipid synthase